MKANNISVKGDTVIGSNISFKISWDNSWYNTTGNPNNYDAVWVFVKYMDCTSKVWNHAALSTNSGSHSADAPLVVDAVSDGRGVFIHRSSAGTGNITSVKCTLKLDTPATAGTYTFKVFGVEMVYVNKADFQVGDSLSASTFKNITINSGYQTGGITKAVLGGGSATADVPATYPMGYNAFYCMKYEVTQEQYVDFLNCLTATQQATRTIAAPSSVVGTAAMNGYSRNGITVATSALINTTPPTPAVYTTSLPNVAMNYMSWADLAAYLDWAAMRPMSDLEFEKICRGTLARVDWEYVWGLNWNITGNITQAYSSIPTTSWGCPTSGLTSGGTTSEVSTASGNGLAAYGNSTSGYRVCYGSYGATCDDPNNSCGPLRVGFAAKGATTRYTSGAAYYGAMDMGGNVWERVIAVNASGVTYTGALGNGGLDASGNADVTAWPGTTAAGTGYRGGSWYDTAVNMRTSERTYATTVNTTRNCSLGGRGVR